jgi:Uma2 family endonuclease
LPYKLQNYAEESQLAIWNRKYKAGRVIESNGGFFLEDSSMRVPDVAWIHIDRWNALSQAEKRSFPRMAPDFVIELKSETDSFDRPAKENGQMGQKRREACLARVSGQPDDLHLRTGQASACNTFR